MYLYTDYTIKKGNYIMSNLGEGIEERTAARVTKEVTKELNAKHAKHAKELTEKLA